MSLRIAINAQLIPTAGAGGTQTVLIGLVHALAQLDGPEEYVLIAPWKEKEPDWLKPFVGKNQSIVREPKMQAAKRIVIHTENTIRRPPSIIHVSTHSRRRAERFSREGKAKSLVGNCFSHAGKVKSLAGNRFSCVGIVKSLAGNHFSSIGKAKSLVGNCFSHAGKVKSHTGNRFSCMGKPKSTRGKSFFRWKKRNPTRRRCFWRAVELYRLVRFVAHPESACAVG